MDDEPALSYSAYEVTVRTRPYDTPARKIFYRRDCFEVRALTTPGAKVQAREWLKKNKLEQIGEMDVIQLTNKR